MYILGISSYYHDSAACLLQNGKIIAAAQEERFIRIKHYSGFPIQAIKYCLEEAKINAKEIEAVVFYEKPFLKFERLIETYLAFAPKGFASFSKAMPLWIKDKLFQKSLIVKELENALNKNINWRSKLLFSEHHLSHAASAFYPSPFENAAILTLDGVGEWATASVSVGKGRKLKIIKEIKFPHSLGLLYSAFTYYIGFKVNSGEYKVMGLAPYGKPIYADTIKNNLITIALDGSFKLNMKYFNFATGLTMTNKKFEDLFGGSPRKPESKISQREMDLAASIQQVLEEVVIKLAKTIAKETKMQNLCLAGGVALNCVANSAISREKLFSNIWIQPAAGDAGGAIGAAFSAWHLHFEKERIVYSGQDEMQGSFLGPQYNDDEVESKLRNYGAIFKKYDDEDFINKVANALSNGKAIGLMQGRMEFGPRALGARSIIADPRLADMQRKLNLKIKYRESFRPFAPSILLEDVKFWFDNDLESPYMLLVSKVKKDKRIAIPKVKQNLFGLDLLNINRSLIPAVTHVDYTARIQTINKNTNPRYHAIVSKFKEKTGCPMVVNTSFNIRGEPIVCTPYDAFKCFMSTNLDILAIGNFILTKDEQDKSLINNYVMNYELD